MLVVEHERSAHAGLVGERIEAAGGTLHVVGPEIGVAVPPDAEGYDGVVVLGGTPGPLDDDLAPWLPGVRTLIQRCLTEETPLLGVCLGAQLLASVAGGTVDLVAGGPEIGVVAMTPTAAAAGDLLLDPLPARPLAVQWHWLEVRALPPGSRSLLNSDRCAHQAFRVGPAAWGLQFHLEVLTEIAAAWAEADQEDLRTVDLVADDFVRAVREAEPELRDTWSVVTDRWVRLVAATAAQRRGQSAEPAGD